MAEIIDKYCENEVNTGGNWYICKPELNIPLKTRIKDAFGVLLGKYVAVYFQEDVDIDKTEEE